MTVSELYKSVAQLGFEDSLEDDDRFIFAVNRALLQVNAIRPVTSAYVINHKPMENKVQESSFTPIEKFEDLYFEASDVKSYYFEADGNGTMYVEKYDEELEAWVKIGMVNLSADKVFVPYRGFIKEDGIFVGDRVRLHFTGDYLYSVRNVAMYEYLYSRLEADIPSYEAYTRYDISALVPDFLSLNSPPIKEEAECQYLNQGYDVEGGRIILLPHDAKGLYKVIYKRKPQAVINHGEAADDMTVLDLDEDLCALLPILVASFVWVDDEPEKAQYYLAIYQERAIDIERRIVSATPVPIKNSNGW